MSSPYKATSNDLGLDENIEKDIRIVKQFTKKKIGKTLTQHSLTSPVASSTLTNFKVRHFFISRKSQFLVKKIELFYVCNIYIAYI